MTNFQVARASRAPSREALLGIVTNVLPAPGASVTEWDDIRLAGDLWLLAREDFSAEERARHASIESRLRDHLLALTTDGHLSSLKRAAVGRTLDEVGDPRDLTELVSVEEGSLWMGSERKGPVLEERPRHRINVPRFRIGRYPVTVGWWRQFVAATDFAADARSLRGPANHPAHDVSWHEARDFCQWLTSAWRAAGRIGPTEVARLPSEVEWERAARGDDTREWPWGDTFDQDSSRGNTSEAGLDRTSAVGLFPQGESPYGCLDMAGNVWEWTMSLGAKNIKKTILPNKDLSFAAERFFNYPYDASDGREDVSAPREFTRVLRGASFGNGGMLARCSSRGGNWPDVHYDNIGFRVVVQAAPPPGSRPRARSDAGRTDAGEDQ